MLNVGKQCISLQEARSTRRAECWEVVYQYATSQGGIELPNEVIYRILDLEPCSLDDECWGIMPTGRAHCGCRQMLCLEELNGCTR